MMANLQHVQQGRCHISFVKERGDRPAQRDIPYRMFQSGGIRNNVWRTYSTQDYAIAACSLTGNKKTGMLRHATLAGATEFITYINSHPVLTQLNHMSPGNVVSTLDYLRYAFNARHIERHDC